MRMTLSTSQFRFAQAAKAALVFAVLSVASAMPARAEAITTSVREVGVDKAGNVLIAVVAGQFNPGGYLVVPATDAGAKSMLATAQAALLSGKNVYINRLRVTSPCPWGICDHATEIRILK